MRPEVLALVALGPLPAEANASAEQLELYERSIQSISAPVTDHEARSLTSLFGEDSCFGLAWSLLHLIETSPNWPLGDELTNHSNMWVSLLFERSQA